MPQTKQPVSVEDVLKAHDRLSRVFPPTPVVHSGFHGAWLKLENLQVTGSFKIRGAFNALAAQLERGDHRAVIAASAGNHAQGVAWAARHFGLRACLVVPKTASKTKIQGCRTLGATVIAHGRCYEESELYTRRLAEEQDGRFLHAFDDPDVIAGQGTVAIEILPYKPDLVLVPVGGGGLAAGMGLVLQKHGIRLIGVQVKGMDGLNRLLHGLPPPRPTPETIADGLRVRTPGMLAIQILRDVLGDLVLVSENAVKRAMVDLIVRHRLITEGAGAAALAGLPVDGGDRKLAVVSGGNVDRAVLARLLRRKMALPSCLAGLADVQYPRAFGSSCPPNV